MIYGIFPQLNLWNQLFRAYLAPENLINFNSSSEIVFQKQKSKICQNNVTPTKKIIINGLNITSNTVFNKKFDANWVLLNDMRGFPDGGELRGLASLGDTTIRTGQIASFALLQVKDKILLDATLV